MNANFIEIENANNIEYFDLFIELLQNNKNTFTDIVIDEQNEKIVIDKNELIFFLKTILKYTTFVAEQYSYNNDFVETINNENIFIGTVINDLITQKYIEPLNKPIKEFEPIYKLIEKMNQ